MSDYLSDYYSALDRLVKNKPVIVPTSSKINNDNVALEAGRKRGSIKKSRPAFEPLISAIMAASKNNAKNVDESKVRLIKAKGEILKYKQLWEESLAREVSLIYEIEELKAKVNELSNQSIRKIDGR